MKQARIFGSIFALALLLLALAWLSLTTGLATASDLQLRLFTGEVSAAEQAVIFDIRLPRLLLALTVGAALALSGLLMQAVLLNPLAEPGIIGVSAGASVGALISLALFAQLTAFTPLFAAAAALGTLLIAYRVSLRFGRSDRLTLVLAGIGLAAISSALIAGLAAAIGGAVRDQIVFWQFGSLSSATWWQLQLTAPLLLVAMLVSLILARQLDLYALGELNAASSGVAVNRLKIVGLLLIAALVGLAVSFVGVVAFVGLIVPHALRLVLGPNHRTLIISSVLGGAALVAAADLVARTAVTGSELPLGLVVAMLGGPLFFALLLQFRKQLGVLS